MAMLALIASWLSFGIVLARRPAAPTKGDLVFVEYGFLPIFVAILMVAPLIWHAMGRL